MRGACAADDPCKATAKNFAYSSGKPIDALQIVLRSDLIKGEQRGGFEGEHGTGGHEGITQGDLGIALAVLRKLTKDVLNRTQQRIGTEMFSSFGNHEAHGNPQQKVESFLS